MQSRKTWSWFPEITTASLCHLLSAKTRGIFSTTFTARIVAENDDDEFGGDETGVKKDDDDDEVGTKEDGECKEG